jgi:hypothetical protein
MLNTLALKIYNDPRTVLTLGEISQLMPDISYKNIRRRATYLIKSGKLIKLRQGIYAKLKFNPWEAVGKIYKPSYISLETVLAREGIVFQYYETIFAASYLTREVKINDTTIQYRRIERSVLTNPDGIEEKEGYFIASRERAFLDAVFIYKDYHFDNLGTLDWEKVFRMQEIYHSKTLIKRVKEYYHHYQEDYGQH